jgi:hypothetical protein
LYFSWVEHALCERVCCAHFPWLLQELTLLQGKHTNEFAAVLGYATDGELIHRGNLALLLAGKACSRAAGWSTVTMRSQ